MTKLEDLKKKLCEQLEEYAGKELSSASLDVVDKLTHTIKNLDKIIDKYEEKEYGNSYYGSGNSYGRMPMMPYSYGNGYDGGNSFARGRNVRRDSMGRYSGGYSRNGDMIMELTELMEDAPDDRTRMEFQKFIQKMQNM